jgi:cytochrome c oxidase assembly protein subunit 15
VRETYRRSIAAWLVVCGLMISLMIVVGGVTRLTRSGLSIVEWQPIVGTLPPLNDRQWGETFEKYKLTPEYKQVNFGMGVDEFKGIFWWEYFHRLLGRLIGLIFFVPYLVFLFRGRVRGPLAWKLLGIFVLGALQGGMGWYMVKSGLVDDPRVSHLRLTAHLGLAFLILGAMFWVALDLLHASRKTALEPGQRGLRVFADGLVAVVFLMVLTGGLVAGIRAGFAYNTFPLMNGHVVPPEIFMIEPWHLNFFNNMATVQFDHRLLAWGLAIAVPWFWLKARSAGTAARSRQAASLLSLALGVQIALGVATVLLVVPVTIATAHQAGAIAVYLAALYCAHATRSA